VVLTDLQDEGHVHKEAFLLKAFLVTFVATKVTGPPAAKSGFPTCIICYFSDEIATLRSQ
jgi:hypothetical protein